MPPTCDSIFMPPVPATTSTPNVPPVNAVRPAELISTSPASDVIWALARENILVCAVLSNLKLPPYPNGGRGPFVAPTC